MADALLSAGAKRPLRVGLVGASMISLFHMRAWSKTKDATVCAVCDPSPENAAKRASEFGIPACYNDMYAMLRAESLDAVDIAAPTPFHAELVRRAADSGLQVMCQKPLAPVFDEAEALGRYIRHRGVRLMVHENWRFRPYYRLARQWIAEGRVGAVQQMTIRAMSSGLLPDDSGQRPALVREPSLRDARPFVLGTVLIHHLDVARALAGPLSVFAARLGRHVTEIAGESSASVYLQTAEGAPVLVEGNMAVPGNSPVLTDTLEVIGTKATIRFAENRIEFRGGSWEARDFPAEDAYQAAFDGCITHFVECLRSGAPFETDVLDNLETLRLVDDGLRAANAGH